MFQYLSQCYNHYFRKSTFSRKAEPIKKREFKGVYSSFGWNGGKMAHLLGCSVTFPNGNSDTHNSWTQDKERDIDLPRPINLGCKKKKISKESLNYNSEETADKILTFQRFEEANIPHPKMISVEQIINGSKESLPYFFLGRANFKSRGQGIVKYRASNYYQTKTRILGHLSKNRKKKLPKHDFFVEFLEFKSEHRVHVFFGQVLCEMNKKVNPNTKDFIHTAEHGSPLEIGFIDHPKRHKIHEYSIKAIKACGLDFGAVDVFIDKSDNIYILEVNSDPGMPGVIGYLYALKFLQLFDMPAPEHWYIDQNNSVIDLKKLEKQKLKQMGELDKLMRKNIKKNYIHSSNNLFLPPL